MITILTRTFNDSQFLDLCLQSISNQTNKDFELIILDDASSATFKQYLYEKINLLHLNGINVRLLENSINFGSRKQYGSLINIGVMNASMPYLMILDSDDMLCPDAVDLVSKLINVSGNPAIIANNMYILNDKKFSGASFDMIHSNFWNSNPEFLFPLFLCQNFICCSSTCISLDYLKTIGGFQSRFSADHSLWLETSLRGQPIIFNSCPIGFYRFHAGGSSSGKADENNVWHEVVDIQNQYSAYLPEFVSNNYTSPQIRHLVNMCKTSTWPTSQAVLNILNEFL